MAVRAEWVECHAGGACLHNAPAPVSPAAQTAPTTTVPMQPAHLERGLDAGQSPPCDGFVVVHSVDHSSCTVASDRVVVELQIRKPRVQAYAICKRQRSLLRQAILYHVQTVVSPCVAEGALVKRTWLRSSTRSEWLKASASAKASPPTSPGCHTHAVKCQTSNLLVPPLTHTARLRSHTHRVSSSCSPTAAELCSAATPEPTPLHLSATLYST